MTPTSARPRLGDRPLRLRVLLPVATGVVALGAVGLQGLATQRGLTEDAEQLATSATVIKNHLTGDMMHDALRADVLAALVAEDAAGRAAAGQDLDEHAAVFLQVQDDNAALLTDPALLAALGDARPDLDAYVAQARRVVGAADDPVAARALLPAFGTAFDALADSQEALSAQIEAYGQDVVQQARDGASSGSRRSVGTVLAALVAMLGLGVVVARTVTRPVARLHGRLRRLADGDLSAPVETWDGDELGEMGRALEAAQGALSGTLRTMSDNATALAAASEQLSATAGAIAASADETSLQSGAVSSSADEVSRSVATVAAGAEEMGAAIREIASSASRAARVGGDAVGLAASINDTVTRLGESSRQIGDVVATITAIAQQTNLLGLNATIEAARAGTSGRGFAVVANEVKELAQETARATEDIGRRVEAIQADTAGAVVAIAGIGQVIGEMNDAQTSIAGAVEEQTATTDEMSRSVSLAAAGSSRIAESIVGVAGAAQVTSSGVADTQDAAAELARMSNELQTLVAGFRW